MQLGEVVNIRTGAEYDVYVGRWNRQSRSGYFGNPYKVGERCARCRRIHLDGGSTLPCFEAYARERLATDPEYRRRVGELADKRLGCWCAPEPCHADVLLQLTLEIDALEGPLRRPEGAEKRRERRDALALRRVREARAQAPTAPVMRGDVYVSGGVEYELWRVDGRDVVLRPIRGRGYIMTESTGPLDPAKWRKR